MTLFLGTAAVVEERHGNSAVGVSLLYSMLCRAGALLLIALAGAAAWDYPVVRAWLLAGLTGYAAILWFLPRAWLVVLPALIPTLILSPWSGRLLYEELDLFLAVTVAVSFWRPRSVRAGTTGLSRGQLMLLSLLIAANLIALARGFLPVQSFDANAMATYYTHYNALRIGKGFFWAILLIPSLRQALHESPEVTCRLLLYGIVSSVFCLGVIVLWEKGVIFDWLHGTNRYQWFDNLLDFGTSYRVTGLFADMNSGGAAIDGYVALTWPFCLLALIAARSRWAMTFAAIALLLGIYVAVVTFSRGTYLAVLVAALVVVVGMWQAQRERYSIGTISLFVVSGVLLLVALLFSYLRGGSLALLGAMAGFAAAFVLGRLREWRPLRFSALALLAGVLGAFLIYAMTQSRWMHTEVGFATMLSMALAPVVIGIGGYQGRLSRDRFSFRATLLVVASVIGVAGVLVPALAGYRMETRFSTSDADTGYRLKHWQSVLASMDEDWPTRLFGMGSGTFPYHFLWWRGNAEDSGSFEYHREEGNQYVSLGVSSDLMLGQRVSLPPHKTYVVSLRVRSRLPRDYVVVRICSKNILFPEDYNPSCKIVEISLGKATGLWQEGNGTFTTGESSGAWYESWPTVVLLNNPGERAVLDIDDVRLLDDEGRNYIVNGDFEQGGDRWLSYNDFRHLSLHIKNLWLNLYFEQGLLGLLGFLSACIYAFGQCIRHMRRGDRFAIVLAAGLAGFFTVGMFDSLLDVPRLSFIFYLLLLTAIIRTREIV